MEFKDYYQALGVQKGASADEIKKSYRKLARKYHPDVSKEPDAQQRMREVNEAYAVLSDQEKKAAYDNLGSRYRAGQNFEPPPDFGGGFDFSQGATDEDFSEFFANLFGAQRAARDGGQRAPRPRRGGDSRARIEIDLADAYHGSQRSIVLGSPSVEDSGRVSVVERTLNVQIPKGIREGQQIRLAGQGNPGLRGGAPGDLYLEIQFAPSARYSIVEKDVTQTLPVAPWEAMLGARIEVPTPSGRVEVAVPPRSKNGTRLRLKGRGIPADPPGDLYLQLELVLPPDSEKARQLFEMMSREIQFNPRESLEGQR
ncbi:MAG TPA: DnaJ C-terminal domain-containing protein [Casimicrobiaceae bacterium]|nr:DnaJ C-terminal domain-containing protein [Casimicrobiaceae bacterium]